MPEMNRRAGLVSVVLPTYNRAGTLARAIRSVLQQPYRDIELIVVDDGSTDETAAIVEQFADDPRLRYAPQPRNRGFAAALNAGLALTRGEFIAFQDSDDEWLNSKLEKQVAAAREAGGKRVTVFHPKVVLGRDESRVYGADRVCIVPAGFDPARLKNAPKIFHRGNVMSTQTILFSADVLDEVRGFDPLLVNSVDWDFSIRLSYATKVVFVPEPLVMTFIQDDSISRRKKGAARSQLRIVRKLLARGDVDHKVLGEHLSRIGTAIARVGRRRSGARVVGRSLKLDPYRPKAWAQLVWTLVRR